MHEYRFSCHDNGEYKFSYLSQITQKMMVTSSASSVLCQKGTMRTKRLGQDRGSRFKQPELHPVRFLAENFDKQTEFVDSFNT